MAKLQSIPDIIFDNTLLEAWGNIWLGTDSSTPGKNKKANCLIENKQWILARY